MLCADQYSAEHLKMILCRILQCSACTVLPPPPPAVFCPVTSSFIGLPGIPAPSPLLRDTAGPFAALWPGSSLKVVHWGQSQDSPHLFPLSQESVLAVQRLKIISSVIFLVFHLSEHWFECAFPAISRKYKALRWTLQIS